MVSDESNKKLAEWSQKSGKPLADLQKRFDQIIVQEQQRNPGTAIAKIEVKARSILLTEMKGEMTGFGSKAIVFKGIVLGTTEAFDLGSQQYQAAKDKYTANMTVCITAYQQAKQLLAMNQPIPPTILSALATDEAGVPVDTRPSYGATGGKNNNFLKPLEQHNFLGNAFGIAAPEGGEVKPFRMQLTGERAVADIPIGVPVQFRANPKNLEAVQAGQAGAYKLNDSTTTKFELDTSGKIPTALAILEHPSLAAYKTQLSGMKSFHDRVQALPDKNDRYNTPAIVQVTARGTSGNTVGNKGSFRFTAEDDSIAFEEKSNGLTVWVPAKLGKYYDFGNGSVITLICSTSEGAAWDSELKATDPTRKEISLTAMGFIMDPELKVSRDEQTQVAKTESVSF